jgi:uncharacterized membrane protein YccC
VTDNYFQRIYGDSQLHDFLHDMARRLSPTAECAEDAEQEAWLAVAQAPDGVSVGSLRAAVVTSVASAVWQERKPRRAWRRWVRELRELSIDLIAEQGENLIESEQWSGNQDSPQKMSS